MTAISAISANDGEERRAVSVRLSPEEWDRLARQARAEFRSLGEQARYMISELFREMDSGAGVCPSEGGAQ
jgi:hypothetical protein